jgi:predicted secreted hydrolase
VEPQAPRPAYRLALPPYRFEFPVDHACHPEFRTEWWYYTGHLRPKDAIDRGPEYGFELTFFRIGLDRSRELSRSRWSLHSLYFAHLAVTDERGKGSFWCTDRVGRPGPGAAGAEQDRYRVWLGDWSASLAPDRKTHVLRASAPQFGVELGLGSSKPPVIHGKQGVSTKGSGAGKASHYYSLTRLLGTGKLIVHGKPIEVSAQAWMDHEFGSNQLSADQAGWDWFSVQLDRGRELMIYLIRRTNGTLEPASSGTLVEPDGQWRHLDSGGFRVWSAGAWRSPRSGATYPARWRIEVPSAGLTLDLTPTVSDQELTTDATMGVTYWEGSVTAVGRENGRAVRGRGYVELTGYAGGPPPI